MCVCVCGVCVRECVRVVCVRVCVCVCACVRACTHVYMYTFESHVIRKSTERWANVDCRKHLCPCYQNNAPYAHTPQQVRHVTGKLDTFTSVDLARKLRGFLVDVSKGLGTIKVWFRGHMTRGR